MDDFLHSNESYQSVDLLSVAFALLRKPTRAKTEREELFIRMRL